jgi:transcriptional regulator with XRE-family HTH domain
MPGLGGRSPDGWVTSRGRSLQAPINAGLPPTEATIAERFGARLKAWRRVQGLKQAALADRLGVSQPAVARWERGLDLPAPARLVRLQELMAGAMRDELALDRLFISRQAAIRALIDCDGIRLEAFSIGFGGIWPTSSALLGMPLVDQLVDEASHLVHDAELSHGMRTGSLCLASGISDRHLDLPIDISVRHRWHICFRRYGARMLADMVYEPCASDLPLGITDLVRIDAVGDILASEKI